MTDEGSKPSSIALYIHCATGCSCCNDENHYTGPYRSLNYVRQLVGEYTEQRRLASQYSQNGNYTICWSEVEILPDGRIIDGDRIFGGYVDDPESDSDEGNIEDSFYPDNCGTKTFPSSYVDPGSW